MIPICNCFRASMGSVAIGKSQTDSNPTSIEACCLVVICFGSGATLVVVAMLPHTDKPNSIFSLNQTNRPTYQLF